MSVNLPFTVRGVDFTGALFVRDNSNVVEYKVYICLFTCAATRAVHLEVVGDLSVTANSSEFDINQPRVYDLKHHGEVMQRDAKLTSIQRTFDPPVLITKQKDMINPCSSDSTY